MKKPLAAVLIAISVVATLLATGLITPIMLAGFALAVLVGCFPWIVRYSLLFAVKGIVSVTTWIRERQPPDA